MRRWIGIGATLLAACGGTAASTTNNNHSCSVTLTGAVSATYDCIIPTAAWDSSKNTGVIGLLYTPSSSTQYEVLVAIGTQGEPAAGHYKNSDSNANGGVTVYGSNNPINTWFACAGTSCGSSSAPAGSWDVNVTSVSTLSSFSSGKTYSIAGTATATVPALASSSATGTVTMTATFQ
jgi:hypothetical protein